MITAQSVRKPSAAPAIPGNGEIAWIGELVNECITGQKRESLTDGGKEWAMAYKEEALLFFEQVTGKEVQPARLTHTQHLLPLGEAGRSFPDALLVNENAIVVVKCPVTSEGHSPLLYIKSDGRAWLKSKIKGERQAWLKANMHEHYMQCQFGLMRTGAKKCYYVSYDPRPVAPCDRMATIELLPDEKIQQDIAERISCATALLKNAIEQLNQISNP